MTDSYSLAKLAMAAGILVLSGTMVLLFFRRVYLDSETRRPVRFSLPLFGNISTQAPVLVLVFFGAFMVIIPLMLKKEPKIAKVVGRIDTGDKSFSIMVLPNGYESSRQTSGPITIPFPLIDNANQTYQIKFLVDKQVIDDQPLNPTTESREVVFHLDHDVQWTPPIEETTDETETKKDVSHEETLKRSKPK